MQNASKQTYQEDIVQIEEESQSPQFIWNYANYIQGINLPVKGEKKNINHEKKDSNIEDAQDILKCSFCNLPIFAELSRIFY